MVEVAGAGFNDRLEDVIQALFEGNPLLRVPPAYRMLRRCINSNIGEAWIPLH